MVGESTPSVPLGFSKMRRLPVRLIPSFRFPAFPAPLALYLSFPTFKLKLKLLDESHWRFPCPAKTHGPVSKVELPCEQEAVPLGSPLESPARAAPATRRGAGYC